jgi:hypothetical protein
MTSDDPKEGLNIGDWVQILSALSILIGIVVVVYEIRQTRAVAEAQLITDQSGIVVSARMSVVGEDGARILAKACDEPAELTRAETEVLSAYYRTLLFSLISRMRVPSETGLLDEVSFGGSWRGQSMGVAGTVLGTPYGRFWWKGTRDTWVARAYPQLSTIFDDILKKMGSGCSWEENHELYLKTLGQSADA